MTLYAKSAHPGLHTAHHTITPLVIPTCDISGLHLQVEQLLDSGVNVNEQDAFGETALHLACMEGALT